MSAEAALREDMARLARSLSDRGYAVGSAGNISARLADGFLVTPTNSCLGMLDPAQISRLDRRWTHVGGDAPSKEVPLHRAFYDTRPGTGAVVHLHSTHATALSCLPDTNPEDCIPPLTPYLLMRVGRVGLLPYLRPGHPGLGQLIAGLGGRFGAVLLANHGPVVAGPDLRSAIFAAEELEESAKLALLLRDRTPRQLSPAEIAELLPR
jgi:3-dehydro-4-phosphotetronate decarboxylase